MNKYLFEVSCTNCKESLDARSIPELEYIIRKHDTSECEFKEVDDKNKFYSSYYISIPGIVRYRDEVDSALEELVFARGKIDDDANIRNAINILNELRLELDDMIY